LLDETGEEIIEELEDTEENENLNPLTISMTDDPDPVGAGQSVTYTISYENNSTETLTGVTVTNFIPAGTLFVSASWGGILQGEQVVLWEIGTLEPGQSGEVSLVLHIPQSSEDGSIFVNTAVIDSNETEAATATEDTLDPTVYGSQMFYVFGWAPDVLDLLSSRSSPAYTVTASSGINSVLSISNAAGGFSSYSTSITSTINESQTSIPVISTASFTAKGHIKINDEIISYGSITANSFESCTRGQLDTSAVTHSSGETVVQYTFVTAYLNNNANPASFNPINPESTPNVNKIIIKPGEVYTINDLIYMDYEPDPNTPSTWKLAGGDMLYVLGGPVNVVRGFVPNQSNGTIYAEYWNLYPVNMWDKNYTVPAGVDTYGKTGNTGDGQDFKYTDLLIQASEDGTVVNIDLVHHNINTMTY